MNSGLNYNYQALSYYTILCSSSSHEYFPGNLNYEFRNKLVDPIVQDGVDRLLECAVLDIFYSPTVKQEDTIFGHEPDSEKVTVINQLRSDLYVTKLEGRIQSFMTHCNQEAKKWGANFEFKIRGTLEGGKFILIQNVEGMKLKMSPDYAKAMGFTKDSYGVGTHVAETLFNQALYDIIPVTNRMNFTTFSDEEVTEIVQEPTAKSAVDLISELNKAIQKHNAFFTYDGNSILFEDENKGSQRTMVKLSPFLERTFGIPESTVFFGAHMKLKSYNNIDLGTKSGFHVIRCNAIENQYFYGKLLNVLKLIPSPSVTGSTVHVKCMQAG